MVLVNPKSPDGQFFPCGYKGCVSRDWCGLACPGKINEEKCGWSSSRKGIRSRRFSESLELDAEATDLFVSMGGIVKMSEVQTIIREFSR